MVLSQLRHCENGLGDQVERATSRRGKSIAFDCSPMLNVISSMGQTVWGNSGNLLSLSACVLCWDFAVT